MSTLTRRQAVILEWILDFQLARGFMPTLREIGAGVGVRSTNGVTDHLKALEAKGFLVRTRFLSRSLVLTEAAKHYDSVRFKPRVAEVG